jgi:hypothetical protein
VLFAVYDVYNITRYEQRKHLIERARIATAAESAGHQLTDEQKEDLKAWQRIWRNAHPDQASLDKEIAEIRGR